MAAEYPGVGVEGVRIPFQSVLGAARRDEGSAGPELKGLTPKVGQGATTVWDVGAPV